MNERPILGISMGDPFGNGPEITVRALADKSVYDRCRPLVVGDKTSMEYAAKVAKKIGAADVKINAISNAKDAKYEYGTIDVLDLGLVPADKIPGWKRESPAGRRAPASWRTSWCRCIRHKFRCARNSGDRPC